MESTYLVFQINSKNQTYNLLDDEIKFLGKKNNLIYLSEIKNEFNINTENSKIITSVEIVKKNKSNGFSLPQPKRY